MHLTLHLTTRCPLRCEYCYSPPGEEGMDMDLETALQAVRLACEDAAPLTGIAFFGGEPLLRRDLIRVVTGACQDLESATGRRFELRMTTNGLLLDEPFLEFATSAGIRITMSHDGVRPSHDRHRVDAAGRGTWELAGRKAELLLRFQPAASVMTVVTPATLSHYAASVDHLYQLGFRTILTSLNYADKWTDEHLPELANQYRKLAEWYESMTLAGREFYLGPLEAKFKSHICGGTANCPRCDIGLRQLSVAPDGVLYPCVQFVKDGRSNAAFAMGDVWNGVDEERRRVLVTMASERDPACAGCALANRCTNDCGCLNWQTTGAVNRVSPILCESERLLTPIVDQLGARLFEMKAPAFLAKHYPFGW